MCLNIREITNKYTHKTLYVKCGHCAACLQEKAIARTNRINNHITSLNNMMDIMFVTLTYDNRFLPYIWAEDLYDVFYREKNYIPIRRDCEVCTTQNRYKKKVKFHRYAKPYSCSPNILDTITFDRSDMLAHIDAYRKDYEQNNFRPIRKIIIPRKKYEYIYNKYSVCYYKDVQNFLKRLRSNLKRNFNYEGTFSSFQTTELGPTTKRFHVHMLLFVPKGLYDTFKRAIIASWPFCDISTMERYIEPARKPAAYLSSYVNCDSYIPHLFKARPFAPKHTYSKNFGFFYKPFLLSSILEMWHKRDFTYRVRRIKQGTVTDSDVMLPAYAISRFFPKFKGYGRLTSFEIFNIIKRPVFLRTFKKRLNYLSTDYDKAVHVIKRSYLRFCECFNFGFRQFKGYYFGLGHYYRIPNDVLLNYFAHVYSTIWQRRSSQVYRRLLVTTPVFECYDNIKDCMEGSVQSPSLFVYYQKFHPVFEPNPNNFQTNLLKHNVLVSSYLSYSKDKKIKNGIMALYDNV